MRRVLQVLGALMMLTGGLRAEGEIPEPAYLVIQAGSHRFRVDARNQHHRSIWNARGRARVSGSQARLEIEAEGYREATTTVRLREGQSDYSVSLTLRDPQIAHRVEDSLGGSVASYSREDGFLVQADEYRFETRIQEDGYSQFGPEDVDVRVNGGFAFGERVDLLGTGASRRLRVTIRRRDLDSPWSNRITLRVPSDQDLVRGRSGAASRRFARRRFFEALHREPTPE